MATHLYKLGGVDSKSGGNTTDAGSDKESDRKECEEHCRSVQETVRKQKDLGEDQGRIKRQQEKTGRLRHSQTYQNISMTAMIAKKIQQLFFQRYFSIYCIKKILIFIPCIHECHFFII